MFTREQIEAALDKAVEAKGADYVYEPVEITDEDDYTSSTCLYVHDRGTDKQEPGCIVGVVYHDLTGNLMPYEEEHDSPNDNSDFWSQFTGPEGIVLLRKVQAYQDKQWPWGIALQRAKEPGPEPQYVETYVAPEDQTDTDED